MQYQDFTGSMLIPALQKENRRGRKAGRGRRGKLRYGKGQGRDDGIDG